MGLHLGSGQGAVIDAYFRNGPAEGVEVIVAARPDGHWPIDEEEAGAAWTTWFDCGSVC
jgi:hypothetical protein